MDPTFVESESGIFRGGSDIFKGGSELCAELCSELYAEVRAEMCAEMCVEMCAEHFCKGNVFETSKMMCHQFRCKRSQHVAQLGGCCQAAQLVDGQISGHAHISGPHASGPGGAVLNCPTPLWRRGRPDGIRVGPPPASAREPPSPSSRRARLARSHPWRIRTQRSVL